MTHNSLREELKSFYYYKSDDTSHAFFKKCMPEIDKLYKEGMNPYQMKMLQYEVIADMFEPIVFANSPFYHETGTIVGRSDGSRSSRGDFHPGGWTYFKNEHLFIDQDPELWKLRCRQGDEGLYLICGPYNDVGQHYAVDNRPILKGGLSSLYEAAKKGLETAKEGDETDFLNAVCSGMLNLKKVAQKFSDKAKEMLATAKTDDEKKYLTMVYETAKRVPWEKPETFYEALCTLAFMRRGLGTLDGVGPNSFGRIDMDLYPFYKNDIENGTLTKEEAYDLITRFLIVWDTHYDHDMKMVGYSDHELENTYVLGGCDLEGKPVYNELTKMFLQATREEKIIYPKIKCRFSKNSPKEYLDEVNKAIISGTSTVLLQNDDGTIPALIKAGRTVEEARDYLTTGCWDVTTQGTEKYDHGSYINILKPFEYAVHKDYEKMEYVGLDLKTFDDAKDFEDLYARAFEDVISVFKERIRVSTLGGQIRDKVEPLPIFSSTMQGCIEKKRDYCNGGMKYYDDFLLCIGFPEVVDSLLAIKTLCFDQKKYTVAEYLEAVRNNWEGHEDMQIEAKHCPGWGDGSEESNTLARRLNDDIHNYLSGMTGTYGGRVHLGHITYTEIRWWGEKTRATPNGRKNGEYISQGLTPSRLKKIPSVTSVVNSFAALDNETMGANSVVNIIMSSNNMTLDICEAFLRACAGTAMQSLQLNCTTKEQLLDAQKHPEKYPDLIVRVCGFSAKFTSLSPDWQKEVLSRNFYD